MFKSLYKSEKRVFLGFCYLTWNFPIFHGRNLSDLDETWWKLFPGVSRSFLNSSGTKITAKNTKKNEIKI